MVELDGKPQPDVRVSFRRANHCRSRSEWSGAAGWSGKMSETERLETSFAAYQPRTFAVKTGSIASTSCARPFRAGFAEI